MLSFKRVFNQNPSVFVFSVTVLALTLIYITAHPDSSGAASVFKPCLSIMRSDRDLLIPNLNPFPRVGPIADAPFSSADPSAQCDGEDEDAIDVPVSRADELARVESAKTDLAGTAAAASLSAQSSDESIASEGQTESIQSGSAEESGEVKEKTTGTGSVNQLAQTSPDLAVAPAKPETGPVDREVRKILEHAVEPGESLWQLARLYRTTVARICHLNGISEKEGLRTGQRVKVEKVVKLSSYTVRAGDTLSTIAKRLNTSVSTLQRLNKINNADMLLKGQELCISREQFLDWPLHRFRLSSRYGMRLHPIIRKRMMHRGVDFGARKGEPIFAAADGNVIFSGWRSSAGKLIKIRHANGMDTLYAHCSVILVKDGQKVTKGQKIGLVGSTGLSTGPHLHFGVKFGKKYHDPMKFL